MNNSIRLNDVSNIKGGSGFPEIYQGKDSGDYPFIKVSDMNLHSNDRYIVDANNYVTRAITKTLNLTVFPENTIVFAKVGAAVYLNKRRLLTRETIIDNNMMGIIPKNIDSEFLYQVMLSIDLAEFVQPGALPSINQKIIGEICIPEFTKLQQKKIADILATIDNTIESTEALINKYTLIKQGMMVDLFTRGIDLRPGSDGTPASNPNYGQLRPRFEEAPKLYKETELGLIPKEWTVERLDHISTRGSGHTPSKSFPEYWNGRIKWVSLADSSKLDNLYIYETDKNISELGLQNSSATMHPKGTVILSRDAGIGKSAILASEMAVSQHFMAWRCGKNLDKYFLYFWLQLKKPEFNVIAMGSTIPTIGLDYFKKLKVSLPVSLDEQNFIAKKILNTYHHIKTLKAEKDKYELMKKGLMQDLLTGKVKIN